MASLWPHSLKKPWMSSFLHLWKPVTQISRTAHVIKTKRPGCPGFLSCRQNRRYHPGHLGRHRLVFTLWHVFIHLLLAAAFTGHHVPESPSVTPTLFTTSINLLFSCCLAGLSYAHVQTISGSPTPLHRPSEHLNSFSSVTSAQSLALLTLCSFVFASPSVSVSFRHMYSVFFRSSSLQDLLQLLSALTTDHSVIWKHSPRILNLLVDPSVPHASPLSSYCSTLIYFLMQ